MSVGPSSLSRDRTRSFRRSRSLALSRLGTPALTLAAGLGAAAPVIASTARAVRDDWVPTDDKGITATLAHDVLSSHTPLLGQFSNAGDVTHHLVYNLGPTLFWLLALPARFGTPGSMVVTMGVVNSLCILATVWLARRRGGPLLMVGTGLAVGLVCRSLAAETFHDIWNASAPLFPFLLLIFLAWSLACGEYRLLPLAVLGSSFVAQAHLAYVAPAAGLMAVGLGGLVLWLRAGRRPEGGDSPGPAPDLRRSLIRWVLTAALVGAICWAPAVIQQLRDHHGNLRAVAGAAVARKATLGPAIGWHVVARTVGVTPWWLIDPSTRWDRYAEALARPGAVRTASALLLLAALVAVFVVGARRGRRDLAAAAAVGLVLCAALAADAAGTPRRPHLASTLGYTLWSASASGMFVWLVLAWSLWLGAARAAGPGLGAALERLRGAGSPRRAVAAAVAGVALVAASGLAVASAGQHDQHLELYPPIHAIAAGLDRIIPAGRTALLEGHFDGSTFPVRSSVRYLLVRRGVRVLGAGSFLRLGYWYEAYHRRHDYAIYLDDRPQQRHPGATLAARVTFGDSAGQHVISTWVTPTGPTRAG